VADVANVHLQGLDGARFRDNTDSNKEKRQLHDIVIASQTDNAFLDTQSAVDLVDPELRRRIRLEKSNSLTTVVWNPWREGSARMQDLGDGQWRQFLCVEASNIMESAVTLEPGEKHTMKALLTLTKL
jgi:glucose-6-phosphate 1-epimerase